MDRGKSDQLEEEARLWVVRVADPAFADWDGLTDWLEADPSRLEAYEAAVAEEARATSAYQDYAARSASAPTSPAMEGPGGSAGGRTSPDRRNRFLRRFALAASLALTLGLGTWYVRQAGPPAIAYATAAGERKQVVLADGTTIALNGDTRLLVRYDRRRTVTMEHGEALFDVRHNAARPFEVVVGNVHLVDEGTVFNVQSGADVLDVAVADGVVLYRNGGPELRLARGDGLLRTSADAAPRRYSVTTSQVGGWRDGNLYYSDAPLTRVGADLRRYLGVKLIVDSSLRRQSFTGTLVVSGSPDDVFARLGPLLGVSFARKGNGWIMRPNEGD